MNNFVIQYLRCHFCGESLDLNDQQLTCVNGHCFSIVKNVPQMLPQDYDASFGKTADLYGKLWVDSHKNGSNEIPTACHFTEFQKAIPHKIVSGKMGLEVGCGDGSDSCFMASKNPETYFVSIDISEGIFVAERRRQGLKNITYIRASASDLPLGSNLFDFAYSFGVLHHLPDPYKGFQELVRVLKPGAPFYLYLYEDHKDQPLKYYSLKIVSWMRKITRKMRPSSLKIICAMASPFVVIAFSWPARVLRQFDATKQLSEKFPFNFGKGLFSVKGDLYDRFGACYEYRFNREELLQWYQNTDCKKPYFTKLQTHAGWVTMANKG